MARRPGTIRRAVTALGGLIVALGLISGCSSPYAGLRLSITTGNPSAVYNQLGTVLASEWTKTLGLRETRVLPSAGSGENLDRLLSGQADIGFSAADAAAGQAAKPGGEHLRALARMHDDYLQLVVPQNSPVQHLADLRGLRVSVGAPNSGVQLIAGRLLHQVNLSPASDIHEQQLGVDASARALSDGRIDAFFWSGGLPTSQITDLSSRMSIRIIDLSDVLPSLRSTYREYGTAIIPASTYHLDKPVNTLLVRNFLLVTDRMPDALAQDLTRGIFRAEPALIARNIAARSIDVTSGLETMPIPLHDGALAFYRSGVL